MQTQACTGHYRLKEITFERFLETYVNLWTPPSARKAVKSGVLEGTPVNRRYKNAIPALLELRRRWPSDLEVARSFRRCGLCDLAEPPIPRIGNLYEAKIWPQLFYDSVLPFDNASAGRCRVGSVVIPFHPGVTASQRHISPGFFGRMTLAVCSFSILHACSAIIGVTPLDLLSCG